MLGGPTPLQVQPYPPTPQPVAQQSQPSFSQQQSLQTSLGIPQAKKRRCAEVCYELLAIESVRMFSDRQGGPPASASLEAVGFRVGRQLAERYTKDKPRLGDTLEIIKFVCKEFWLALFKKQVDNLRTNHRGVFVLQDNSFRWLQRLTPASTGAAAAAAAAGGNSSTAADSAREEALRNAALLHLHMPCGVIRGALCHMGVPCTVEADPKALPACAFTIKIVS